MSLYDLDGTSNVVFWNAKGNLCLPAFEILKDPSGIPHRSVQPQSPNLVCRSSAPLNAAQQNLEKG